MTDTYLRHRVYLMNTAQTFAAETTLAILDALAEQCERAAARASQDPSAPGTTYNREEFILMTNLRSVYVNARREAEQIIRLAK